MIAETRLTHPNNDCLATASSAVLRVFTLGEERIMLNAKTIPIPLRRAVEVVAYFLESSGKISLNKLRLDLFPDDNPQTSRNYFHQFRHELHTRLPEFRIVYHAAEHLYALETDLTVVWDVAELRAGRKMGGLGIFLPSSGSEWAEHMEYQLEPLRSELVYGNSAYKDLRLRAK
ncbi:MAG: hypothetical protein ACRCYY_14305 [Trueperaceae bacterium]